MKVYLMFEVGNGNNPKPSTAQVYSDFALVFQRHKDTYDHLLKEGGWLLRKHYSKPDLYLFEEYMTVGNASYHMPVVYCVESDPTNPPKQNKRISCPELWQMFKKEGFV